MDIQQKDSGKGGKVRGKKASTHIDFAPMVDLSFLLITFFMLATTLIKPQTMEIAMPSKDKVQESDAPKVNINKVITILLDKDDNIYYYFGAKVEETDPDPELIKTQYGPDGLRKMLLERNINVMLRIKELRDERSTTKMADSTYKRMASEIRSDQAAPVVIIKATDEANYKNLVDVLDEMQICNIGKYAIVDITDYDIELIQKLNN